MRIFRILPFLAIVVFSGCELGQLFGPNTAKVTVGITVQEQGDVFTPYINFEPYRPDLTDSIPAWQYRPRIQTRETCSRSYCNYAETGDVFVSLWSQNLGRMSELKKKRGREDKVIGFEFDYSDFR